MSCKHCPYCKKPLHDEDASFCLFCGESIKQAAGLLGRMRYARYNKMLFVVIVLFILVGFLLMIAR